MSPRRTPAETTAPAKPTRARPSRSRSVMSSLHSIVPCEHPHRRLEQLPDLPVADLPGCLALAPPARRPALVGAGDALTTLEIGPACRALPGAYYRAHHVKQGDAEQHRHVRPVRQSEPAEHDRDGKQRDGGF